MYDFEVIAHQAKTRPNDLAYVDEAYKLTFKALDVTTRKIGFSLLERGIRRGDLVATALPPYQSWLFTLALQRLGTITLTKNNLNPFAPEVIPDWFIGFENHPQMSGNRMILCDSNFETQLQESDELLEFPGYVKSDDAARLLFTSGTTGELKYLKRTVGDLSTLVEKRGSWDLFGTDPLMSLYPLSASQTYRVTLKSLMVGKTYYNCTISDYRLPKILSDYSIESISGSPAQVSSLLDALVQTNTQLPALRNVVMGGSNPSSKLIARINSLLDCRIVNAYGTSEAGNIAHQIINENKSKGLTLNPDGVLQIVDENNTELPNGVVGKIRYKKSDMFTSYYKNPLATQEFFKDGFFYPGDFGLINSEGELELAGRSREVINLGGVKLNPDLIDELVSAQLGVLDCATFAAESISGIEQVIVAIIVDEDFEKESFEKVLLKKSPVPVSSILITDHIPRNENGKVLRQALKEKYEAEFR
jgi:acyl-coenzyme A synthetase/AMP-(fatty) acid ligase